MSRKQPNDCDHKDGCPKGTLVVRCTSGPVYTLLITGSSPKELRDAVRNAGHECVAIEHELAHPLPEDGR